jgi:D-alanine transaminase
MHVYLDGAYRERALASVSVDDRGFLFGDGAYEVIRVVNGRLVALDRHARRLRRTLDGLSIAPPAEAGTDALTAIIAELLARDALRDGEALIYVQITRGAAPRTHQFPIPDVRPTVYVAAAAFTPPRALRERGASVITHPDIRWGRCDLKTVNLLPNTLAKQRAVEAGADEAVLVREGVVTEGSTSNIFAVIDGELRTHPLTTHILGGVTREVTVEAAAALGVPTREAPVLLEELPHAEELFLTSTTNDVMPIARVDGQPVGTGRPGPVTLRLHHAVAERLGME